MSKKRDAALTPGPQDLVKVQEKLAEYIPFDDEYTPPEILLDETNPANDPYFLSLNRIKRTITSQATKLRPQWVETAKLTHLGVRPVDIAARLGITPSTVSTTLGRPEVRAFLGLLRHHTAATDGPNTAQRMNLLWRIAQDNEIPAPKVAITAVEVLNKMTHVYADEAHQGTGTPQINIVINSPALQRGPLDQDNTPPEPQTYAHSPDSPDTSTSPAD